ncbi:MAG: hypothetical protein K6F84_08595 [Lachnospiraceae bacterium]|nr:hypothetical protein [Lachnospiraceae bacterium]
MDIFHIILLCAGIVIFIISFILPASSKELEEDSKNLAKDQIKELVNDEFTKIRSHVDDIVNESIDYAVEKTERGLERLSNEKIQAVNEYSDTVMNEINKNHKEVMFLYDMLNDKHESLMNSVAEANKAAKDASDSVKEAESIVNSLQELYKKEPESFETLSDTLFEPKEKKKEKSDKEKTEKTDKDKSEKVKQTEKTKSKATKTKNKNKDDNPSDFVPLAQKTELSFEPSISFMGDADEGNEISNEKILELHRQGKSNVAIAKSLGLGVGEVKLVIDLYKNM